MIKIKQVTNQYQLIYSKLLYQDYLIQKEMMNLRSIETFKFIQLAQNTTMKNLTQVQQWSYPMIVKALLNYYYNDKTIETNMTENITIPVYYPLNEFIDKTSGITTEQIKNCICPIINQTKCNNINNTNYEWEAEVCAGAPVKLKITIKNRNVITQYFPYYLFSGNCTIEC